MNVLFTCSVEHDISVNTVVHVIPDVPGHRHNIARLADVVHSPEWFKARRKRSPDELIVTVGIAGVFLRGVVGAGVGGIVRGILLLAENTF